MILGFVAVALLPLVVMGILYFNSLSDLLIETVRHDLEAGTQHTVQTLDSFFSENTNHLQAQTQLADFSDFLKGNEAFRSSEINHVSAIFRSLGRVRYEGYQQSYLLLDQNGIVVYDQTQLEINKDLLSQSFFQNAWQTNSSQITLTPADEHGKRSIYFSAIVWDEYENKVGVLALRYDIKVLQFIIDETSKYAGEESFAILTEQDGNIVGWHKRPNPPQKSLSLEGIAQLSLARNISINKNNYALIYMNVNTAPLSVIYVRDEASLQRYLQTQVTLSIAIALGVLVLTISLALLVAQQILKPINELTSAVQSISNRDWSARARVTSTDEIGLLGNTFNQLADRVLKEVRNVENLNRELKEAYNYTLDGWAKALELRDKETEGHSQRVTWLALELGRVMGLNEEELENLRFGAQLHDIGKMVIPDEILHKPGPLTNEEREIIKKHPNYAYEILKDVRFLDQAIVIPRYHHEKWDGTGYPSGLQETEIPLFARIFCVADVWDAVTSNRPYNSAWPTEKAKAYLIEQKGKHFDPEIVDIFLSKVLQLKD